MAQISVRHMETLNFNSEDVSPIILVIDPNVVTTESYIPNFSLATFIADLGGSLGLWLGVGVVQILRSAFELYKWGMSQ